MPAESSAPAVASGPGAGMDSAELRRLERAAQGLRRVGARVVRVREPMASHTTLQVGGPAALYVEADRTALAPVLNVLAEADIPVFPLGRGSNLLVSDRGLRAAAVRLIGEPAQFNLEDAAASVSAGMSLSQLANEAAGHGLAGLELLGGVPGSVGGALFMNAGAYGVSIGDLVDWVEWLAWDGSVRREAHRKLRFGYRDSGAARLDGIITAIGLRFERGDPEDLARRLEQCSECRRSTQPIGEPSAGCVFKNPAGRHAGQLIEEIGGKGLACGGARISDKHANFIISWPGASAADIACLIERVRELVQARAGIGLELELQLVGEW